MPFNVRVWDCVLDETDGLIGLSIRQILVDIHGYTSSRGRREMSCSLQSLNHVPRSPSEHHHKAGIGWYPSPGRLREYSNKTFPEAPQRSIALTFEGVAVVCLPRRPGRLQNLFPPALKLSGSQGGSHLACACNL